MYSDKISMEQLFADVRKMLGKFYSTNLVSEGDVIIHAMDAMKSIGNNLTDMYEEIVPINNYKGTLPDNLVDIHKMFKCNLCNERTPRARGKLVQSIFRWVETHERVHVPNGCDICDGQEYSIVGKAVEYLPDIVEPYRLRNRTELKFGEGIIRSFLAKDCSHSLNTKSPYDVDVTGKMIKTSFEEGTIYIQYRGLEVDGKGQPLIKDSQRGAVYRFIRYYVAAMLLELIVAYDESAAQLYQLMDRKQSEYFRPAVSDSKASTLTVNAFNTLRNSNVQRVEKFFRPENRGGFRRRW